MRSRFFTPRESPFTAAKFHHVCTRVLELQKRSNTIECASADDLIRTLGIVKSSVANGELDSVIEAASVKVRERFGK